MGSNCQWLLFLDMIIVSVILNHFIRDKPFTMFSYCFFVEYVVWPFLAIACCSLDPWTNVCLLVVLPILVVVGDCVYVQSILSSFGAFGWSVVLVSLRKFLGPFLVNVRCALVFLGPIFVY